MLNFFNLVITDIKISFRKKNESIISVLFFLFSILILPLIFQGDQEIIKKFLVGIVWFLTLLTIIFSVEKLFENDYEDGILDQIYISGIPLETIFFSKSFSIWIITCLPLVFISPVLLFLFNLRITYYLMTELASVAKRVITFLVFVGSASVSRLPIYSSRDERIRIQ